jgi:hypothetical protein
MKKTIIDITLKGDFMYEIVNLSDSNLTNDVLLKSVVYKVVDEQKYLVSSFKFKADFQYNKETNDYELSKEEIKRVYAQHDALLRNFK